MHLSLFAVRGHAVVGEQEVQEGAKHTPLGGPRVEGQHGRGVVANSYHLWSARREVQDLVLKGRVQSQGPELGDELGGHYDELQSMNRILTYISSQKFGHTCSFNCFNLF